MTEVEKKLEQTESSDVMTDSKAVEEPKNTGSDKETVVEEEFSDAMDEMNIKTAQDLTQVISELKGSVPAMSKEEIVIKPEENDDVKRLEPQDIGLLDTIPEDELNTSLINGEEDDSQIKADIDIPLTTTTPEVVVVNDISAPTEPNSPRPSATDFNIANHFEKIRNSIDLPADRNMADFVTPPTPGLAPPSSMMLNDDIIDDENNDDLPNKSSIEELSAEKVNTSTSTPAPVTVPAGPPKPSNVSTIPLSNIDFDLVKPNFLTPRAQERYGKFISICVCTRMKRKY